MIKLLALPINDLLGNVMESRLRTIYYILWRLSKSSSYSQYLLKLAH